MDRLKLNENATRVFLTHPLAIRLAGETGCRVRTRLIIRVRPADNKAKNFLPFMYVPLLTTSLNLNGKSNTRSYVKMVHVIVRSRRYDGINTSSIKLQS